MILFWQGYLWLNTLIGDRIVNEFTINGREFGKTITLMKTEL